MEKAPNQLLAELVQETARGNSEAFKRLYDGTSSYLFALMMKMMQDKSLAEDVLQDAFVQVWHRAGDYHSDRGSVLTWLTAIARYRAIDVLRKRRDASTGGPGFDKPGSAAIDFADRLTDELQGAGSRSGPLSSAIASEDSRQLRQCLRGLSQVQVQSVALAFFHGLTHQELSKCLALPLGTIKSRLRRSLERLKKCLAELGYAHEISSGSR